MKKVINLILAVCAVALVWALVESIMGPINFEKEQAVREAAVKKRLIQIREAEEQYKLQHEGMYCDTMENLIQFINEARIATVIKEGELTDDQMDAGLTEAKAAAIVRSGNASEIAAKGLQGFRRDTAWVSLKENLFGADFNADSLAYIPYSDGEKFELEQTFIINKSGTMEYLMECRAPIDSYMKGMNANTVASLKEDAEKYSRYSGLKIGDLDNGNNNAGNWE
jgi:hypothetical protein